MENKLTKGTFSKLLTCNYSTAKELYPRQTSENKKEGVKQLIPSILQQVQ